MTFSPSSVRLIRSAFVIVLERENGQRRLLEQEAYEKGRGRQRGGPAARFGLSADG